MGFLNPIKEGNQYKHCKDDVQAIYLHTVPSVTSDTIRYDASKTDQNYSENYQKYLENRIACNDLKAQWAMSRITWYAAFSYGSKPNASAVNGVIDMIVGNSKSIRESKKPKNRYE